MENKREYREVSSVGFVDPSENEVFIGPQTEKELELMATKLTEMNGSSISQREAPEQTVGSCMGYLNEQGRVEEGINANIIGEAGISSEATKGMDIAISISTAYETPRDSLNSVPFESFLSVSPSLPGATKEEPEDEQVVSSVGRSEEMKPIHSEKNCIPLENEKPNVNTPVVEKFSTPVSTPLRWKNSVKKEKTNPQHLKTACPMPAQSTPVTYKTPPTTPHFTNSAKKASSSHSKPRTPSSMTKKVAQKLFVEEKAKSRIPKPTTNPKLATVSSPVARYIKERPVAVTIRQLRPLSRTLPNSSNDHSYAGFSSDKSYNDHQIKSSAVEKENSDPKSSHLISKLPLPPVHRKKPDAVSIRDVTRPAQKLPAGQIGRLLAPNARFQIEKHTGRVRVGDNDVSVLLSKPAEIKKW
ncbi:hypothetical protein QYM36_007487 [Artemia franciscana]|uniref:Uncharacterized protein n=1 Tax=Artemia franciscana TaxID=6661 RepID=A0AA88IH10_ARTSF|nr:hypothetical protein QYM36_007487 [Artemia franciscana]